MHVLFVAQIMEHFGVELNRIQYPLPTPNLTERNGLLIHTVFVVVAFRLDVWMVVQDPSMRKREIENSDMCAYENKALIAVKKYFTLLANFHMKSKLLICGHTHFKWYFMVRPRLLVPRTRFKRFFNFSFIHICAVQIAVFLYRFSSNIVQKFLSAIPWTCSLTKKTQLYLLQFGQKFGFWGPKDSFYKIIPSSATIYIVNQT